MKSLRCQHAITQMDENETYNWMIDFDLSNSAERLARMSWISWVSFRAKLIIVIAYPSNLMALTDTSTITRPKPVNLLSHEFPVPMTTCKTMYSFMCMNSNQPMEVPGILGPVLVLSYQMHESWSRSLSPLEGERECRPSAMGDGHGAECSAGDVVRRQRRLILR